MDEAHDSQKLNAYVAEALAKRRDELALSLRQVEERSGVNHMTVKRMLDNTREMRINDFFAVARALGLSPSGVVREAEDRVAAHHATHTATSATDPTTYTTEAERRLHLLQQNDYGLAAKTRPPSPLDTVGEENQDEEGE